jgi:hypothetical protein
MSDKAKEARAQDSEPAKAHSNVWSFVKKLHKYYSMPMIIDAMLSVAGEWANGYMRELQDELGEGSGEPEKVRMKHQRLRLFLDKLEPLRVDLQTIAYSDVIEDQIADLVAEEHPHGEDDQ